MLIGSGERGGPIENTVFELASLGINSNRDPWVFNSSRQTLSSNMRRMISTYNAEIDAGKPLADATNDPKEIKWSSSLTSKYERGIRGNFTDDWISEAHYRPFCIQNFYGEPIFVHRYGKMRRIFPDPKLENLIIQVSGTGARAGFAALMSNRLPDLHTIDSGQCFPLYLYEESQPGDGLFAASGEQLDDLERRDGITDGGLAHFQAAYPGQEISKEDLFYYTYGLLHSPDYRERYKNNLAKQLPRIPAVKTFEDFASFRDAGRALGDLPVNFESVEPYMVTFKEGDHRLIPEAQSDPVTFYRVKHTNKWKWGGKGKEKDLTTVIYNENITLQNIPLEAYDYVVNGKPALEWVMERQIVKTDKKSGIVNDANDYANETVGDPKYPLELFQRVITVSLETIKIVNNLPSLDID